MKQETMIFEVEAVKASAGCKEFEISCPCCGNALGGELDFGNESGISHVRSQSVCDECNTEYLVVAVPSEKKGYWTFGVLEFDNRFKAYAIE